MAAMLLIASLVSGYWWFYKLAPWRRALILPWSSAHSQRE
jgi:hypothetical protein